MSAGARTPMVNVHDGRPGVTGGLPMPGAPLRSSRPWIAWDRYRGVLLSAASLLIAFSIWQVLSTFIFNPFLIPPPLEVIRTAIPMVMSGEIFADVAISMTRVLVGFVSGSQIGRASCREGGWRGGG